MKQANIEGEIGMREFLAVLDEEVARLPEKLRLPLVLCCLEGKTQAEAAEELGWKEGTLSGRLAEARERLRRRLTKRGIALSAAWGALTLGQDATAVPLRLAEATLRAALHPETASVSVSVAAVVQGVSKALVFGRLKMMARFLFVFTVLGTGAGAWALRASDTPSPAAPAKNRPTPGADHQAKDKPVANDQHGDPLPEGAVLRLGTLRLRHSHTAIGRGLGLAFLADGKTLVSAGDDHTIRFWDLKTGKEVRRLIEPDPANLTLAMTLDGPRLVVAGSKGIRLFDATTAAERRAIPTRGLGQPMAFSADGKSLASIDDRLGFHVWDVTTGKERLAGKGLDAGVRSLCFSADGKKLVTGLTNATTLIWRIPAAR